MDLWNGCESSLLIVIWSDWYYESGLASWAYEIAKVSNYMTIQKTVALIAAPVGLLFWFIDPSYLLSVITQTGLDWHGVFLPLALGIILGCLAGMLKLDKLQRIHPVVIVISTGLFTCGVVGAAAVYASHQYWF